ncbi:MAG: phage tail protein [Pseudomonadota bacterium]
MPLKRFLMASALALSFVVSAPTVAKADPITATIVAWATSIGINAAVATFVVNSALYAAGSWAVSKAAKALGLMKTNVAERQASVTTLSLGETPREAVVGIACVGGSLIDAWNHGGKYGTDYVTRRVALADHVLDGLIGYYVDDTYYSFNGNGVQPGFNGALQLTFVNATRDGAFPPPYMLQAGVGLTSADRCPSVAEIWITYKFDDQVWTRGHPGLKFVVRGLRAYDPRFDPQFGYTGPSPQTWDDVSTHRFSENAAVVRYNIQRGIYAVGRHGELEHLLIGRGLSADEAPAARIIAAANVCDEIVDGLPRYTVGGAISSAQAHIEVEEMFAAATAGQIVQRDGGVEVEPGQAKAAVVTITDADLVAGEAISFDEFTPDTDGGRINTVIARYVEPSQLYKDHSGAVLRNQADIIEDGGPRELTLPLMLVTNKGQADRCAEISRRGARLERRARIALVPMLLVGRASAELEDGDIIAWQSNRYHEGATVRYRIEAYGVDEGWRNTLQLREMASSVFGQADPVEDRAAPPPPPTPIDALVLTDVTAEAITLPGDSSILPAIRFRWDAPVDAAVLAIRAEVRRLGESESAPTRTEEVNAGVMIATNGVGPDQQLQARLVPIGDPSRPVLASAWVTVSTPGLVAGDVSPTAPGLSQMRSDIEAAFGDIFDVSELLTQARTDIDAQGVEIAAARGGQPSLNSRIVQVNQARIDGDTANATAITNLTARTALTEADIIDLENAVATEAGARAQAVNQLTARLVEAPNLLANSDGALSLKGWNIGSGVWEVISHPAYGTAFRCASAGTHFLRSDFYPCEPGQLFNLSLNGDGGSNPSGDQVGYIEFWSRNDDLPNTLLGTSGQANANDRDWLERRSVGPVAAPGVGAGGAWFWRMILRKTASTDAAAFTRIMINSGPAPVQWSDQATGRSLSASVTQHSLAIIDLENQQNIALWRIKAEASGSRPAIIEAYSGLGVSALAFSAEQLYLGDNTVFDDATNTWQTIDGSTVYIRAEGAPFGAFNNLREWWGPTGIALGGMTPDNGYSGRMTTAPYNFTNTLNPRTFSAYASPGSIEAHRSNAGSLTSAAVSILYQNAKGAVSVTWERLIGGVTAAGTAVIDAPNELTTTFTKTVSAQERTDTVFQATLTDAGSGERRQVIVPVVFTSGAA